MVTSVKIAVIADTHVNEIDDLPPSLLQDLRNADLIVHLGDYVSPQLVNDFISLGDFCGITGNHDNRQIRGILPRKDIIEVNGKRLGLIHGHGCRSPIGMQAGLSARFKQEKLDVLLYGHTHIIENQASDGVLFFNPGSAAGRFPALEPSYGLLTVGESISSEIRYFNPLTVDRAGRPWGDVVKYTARLAKYTAELQTPQWYNVSWQRMFGWTGLLDFGSCNPACNDSK